MKFRKALQWGVGAMVAIGSLACKQNLLGSSVKDDTTAAPTSGGAVEGQMSAAMRDFRDKFVTMETADDVDSMLGPLRQKVLANQLTDTDIKLVAAQLLPIYNMRGIVYRLKQIVEQNGGKTFHSIVVTGLMQIATGAHIFQPTSSSQGTNAWSAINHYFAYPYPDMANRIATEVGGGAATAPAAAAAAAAGAVAADGTATSTDAAAATPPTAAGASLAETAPSPKFNTVAEFQTWLTNVVLPDLNKSITIIEGITIPDGTPVVWDNQIIYGRNSFGNDTDAHDRFVTIRESERKLILAGLYSMRHNLYFFTSYNYEDFPAMVQKMGRLIGMDGFLFTDVQGMSARDRAQVICPSRGDGKTDCAGGFTNLFTKTAAGNTNMPLAFADLNKSVSLVKDAWEGLKGRSQSLDDFQLLDPAKIIPWQRINQSTVDNMVALVSGQPVRNAVTGKMTQVNVQAFYTNPPADLKAFLPIGFDGAPQSLSAIGPYTDIRNYEYGESKEWDQGTYSPYFPDVKDGTEVPTVMKDLSQTWGGWLVNTPLATVSMVF